LIVEDDIEMREALANLLLHSGYQVATYADGTIALNALLNEAFDLAIVDWILPGISGLELVRSVRQHPIDLPILLMTGRASLRDRVAGLDIGADDYLVKPFAMAELEARVRALLRRRPTPRTALLKLGPLTWVPGEPRMDFGGTAVNLSAKELALLEALTVRPGRPVSKEVIAGRLAHGGSRPSDTAIEICVHRLRRRL